MYYFAYGSNLDQQQMKERCPEAIVTGKAFLKDYTLAFTIFSPKRQCGCADVVQNLGGGVWGLLYTITPKDLQELDKFEGHPIHYKRFTVSVVDESGKSVQAETYEVVHKQTEYQKTSKDYLGKITRAADTLQFPLVYRIFLSKFETID